MRYLLPLALAAILGGCSSDKSTFSTADSEVTVDHATNSVTVKNIVDGKTETHEMSETAGEMKVTSSDGSVLVGGTKVPEAFPLKVPAGAAVQSAMHSKKESAGEEIFLVQFTTSGPLADTAADYEKQLKEKGLTVDRVDQSSDGTSVVILNGESEKNQAMVQIGTEEGNTSVLINWTKQTS